MRHKDHRGPAGSLGSLHPGRDRPERASLSHWCVHSPPQAEKAWKDASLYFSGDEWAAMGDWEKGRRRTRKRNFDMLLSRGSAQAGAGPALAAPSLRLRLTPKWTLKGGFAPSGQSRAGADSAAPTATGRRLSHPVGASHTGFLELVAAFRTKVLSLSRSQGPATSFHVSPPPQACRRAPGGGPWGL